MGFNLCHFEVSFSVIVIVFQNYFNILCLAFRFPVDKELDAVLPLFDVEAVHSLLNSRSLADKARLQLSVSVPHASAWIWTAP